jgi:alpha-tubulin suppressor-like RCC1 family protein
VYGQVGVDSSGSVRTPTLVAGLAFSAIDAGESHTCGITTTGEVRCWGRNNRGQLGIGSEDEEAHPTPTVVALAGPTAVAGGEEFTCVIAPGTLPTPAVHCWGTDTEGRLGQPEPSDRLRPSAVPGTEGATALWAGYRTACAATDAGLLCWGRNTSQQLGPLDGSVRTPTAVDFGADVTDVAIGEEHVCILRTGGVIDCLGDNTCGQLGTGGFDPASSPVRVGLEGAYWVAAEESHTCAVSDAGLFCWGNDSYGKLGLGRPLVVAAPTRVDF